MSSKCTGKQYLAFGSGTLPHQNQTSYGKADSWNLKKISVGRLRISLAPRAAIYFLWLKHTLNQVILSELGDAYGKNAISLGAVKKWTAPFCGGRTELVNLPRSEKPPDTGKVDRVRALIEGEGYLSQKKIAQVLGIHHETVKQILRDDPNARKVNSK
jgi:hypothetical protein